MRLFVGLGNPGAEYQYNRHNFGFMVVGVIARRHGVVSWRRDTFGAHVHLMLGREQVILLLPLTSMYESGRAVRKILQYSEVGQHENVVFHDEIELPLGKVRIKTGGGLAGHN